MLRGMLVSISDGTNPIDPAWSIRRTDYATLANLSANAIRLQPKRRSGSIRKSLNGDSYFSGTALDVLAFNEPALRIGITGECRTTRVLPGRNRAPPVRHRAAND